MTNKILYWVKEYRDDDLGMYIAADHYGEAADIWRLWTEKKEDPEKIEKISFVVIS